MTKANRTKAILLFNVDDLCIQNERCHHPWRAVSKISELETNTSSFESTSFRIRNTQLLKDDQ